MSNASVDHALDIIYNCVCDMAGREQYEELDFILQYLNTKDMPTDYLLGVATATLPCKSKLIQREGFMNRVDIALIERSENNVELLKGLF